jgi:glycosyltransferase involved in cell wall biosynthesis
VALVADGLGSTHGVAHAVQQIRNLGVPGFEVEVIGTDADVDRRLSAVAEVDVPFYAGLKVGVPSITSITEVVAEGRYDLVHVCSPGPAGVAAWGIAKLLELPLAGSYHTELAAYAALRSGYGHLEMLADYALGKFYGACDVVLSPSTASDERLEKIGVDPRIVARWDRGVDLSRFDPGLRDESLLSGEITVLYAGRMTKEKGVELLAIRACVWCWPAAVLRNRHCASALGPTPPSSAGSTARIWRGPTRARTCSCSRAAPTPSVRWCSRLRPAGCRSWRSLRAVPQA